MNKRGFHFREFDSIDAMLAHEKEMRIRGAAKELYEALKHAYMIGQGGIPPLPETLSKWHSILAKIEGEQ